MKKLLIALAITGLSAPALAQETTTPPMVSFDTSVLGSVDFATIDVDASGGVSFDELAKLVPDLTQEDFIAIDIDANGEVSADELAAVSASSDAGATTTN